MKIKGIEFKIEKEGIKNEREKLKFFLENNFHFIHQKFLQEKYPRQYQFYYNSTGEFIGNDWHPYFNIDEVEFYEKQENSDKYYLISFQEFYDYLYGRHLSKIKDNLEIIQSPYKKLKIEKYDQNVRTKIINKEILHKICELNDVLVKEVGKELAEKVIENEKIIGIQEEENKEYLEIKKEKDKETVYNSVKRILVMSRKTKLEMQEVLKGLISKLKDRMNQEEIEKYLKERKNQVIL